MAWAITAVGVLILLAVYASWTAGRLDRLHARLDATAAGLDAQLQARATAAMALAAAPPGRHPALPHLEALAAAARAATAVRGLGHDRELAESALSRALRAATPAGADSSAGLAAVTDAAVRASFARRFYNDAVRDVLGVRRRWVVRLLHLAGHAPRPAYFEMDDGPLRIGSAASVSAPYD